MPLTKAERTLRARMGGYARAALMSDEERIRHASRMSDALRESFDSDAAYKAHMTGLALRSSRRRSPQTPAPPSDLPCGGVGVDHPLEET